MMPHPERCMESELGNEDGYLIMSGLLNKAIQNG
jgi:phosphoribosylformylglycinamidine (FGAM) synthase-like amidotransferase family enzyme